MQDTNLGLDNVLANAMQKAIELAEQGGRFALDIAPDLITEFITWKLWGNGFMGGLGIILFIIGIILFRKSTTKEKVEKSDSKFLGRYFSFNGEFGVIIGFIISLIGIGLFFTGLYYVIYISVAPKIYMIDYFLT